MDKLKSFVYLNSDKVYSISSQLFEGLTEYVVRSEGEKTEEVTEQKGPMGSGRLLADIIEKQSSHTEKKFLHDYSYIIFETKLLELGKVLNINQENAASEIVKIGDYSFIKITGRVCFNDAKIIEDTLANFNEIGFALGYIGASNEIEELKGQKRNASKKIHETKDRNVKSRMQNILNSRADLQKIFRGSNLQIDPDKLASLEYIVNYGYNQQFEILMPFHTHDTSILFSGILNRSMLKEEEHIIIKKYSRETEKEFTIFGIVTQSLPSSEKLIIFNEDDEINAKEGTQDRDKSKMKQAIWNLIAQLTNMEKAFTGKLDYEYIIDPIAVYREL